MERIAAIVEGHLETHFMNESYPKVLVQRCISNGHDVKLELIIDEILDRVEVLDGSIRKIVILFDREKRQMESEEIIKTVVASLSEKHPTKSFYIGVADREIENWILADVSFIKKRFKIKEYDYYGDGVSGKAKLAKLTKSDLAPRDKARLLKSISPVGVGLASPSLSSFISQIDFPWQWAES